MLLNKREIDTINYERKNYVLNNELKENHYMIFPFIARRIKILTSVIS